MKSLRNRWRLMAASLCLSTVAFAQSADPVIMKVNGKDITRSEFEYSFNKNNGEGVIDKKTVKEYVPLFVNFKLKVAEAEYQKIDTLPAIRKELDGFKEQMVIPTIVDTAFIEKEARRTYENTAARFAGADLLTASHILVLMRQDATAEQQAAAKVRIDSIYNVLTAAPADKLAETFTELAKKHSDDTGSAKRGGQLGQFGKGMMIPDFEKAAYELKVGEMSAPVKTTVGYHIIYVTARNPFEPFEFHHDNIIKFLEQRGIKEASANAHIDSLAKQKGVDRKTIVDQLHKGIIAKDADLRFLAQEYYDGTLMYEVAKKDVWDKAQSDEAGKEAFFEANKKKYVWDLPRFAGIVIYAKDTDTMKKAKKLLKGVAEPDYATTIVKALNNDSVKLVRIERGLFKLTDNAVVDNKIFKHKTEIKPKQDYPVADVYGKKLKAPRTYKDVSGQVTSDYQSDMEKRWVESLRQKFSFEVYDNVVETVNNH